MRLLLAALAALTGCVNGTQIVRDVYVIDSFLVVEKCYVKASSDRLVVDGCREEHQPLPARVAGATRALPPLATPPPLPSVAPANRSVARANPGAPPPNAEVEIEAPAAQAPDGELPPGSAATPTPAPGRTGFAFLRGEVLACGEQFHMTGVVNVVLELNNGKVTAARTKEGQGTFEQCVETRLVGVALPESQANRTLTVPFALRR